jgi:hypothetical protein
MHQEDGNLSRRGHVTLSLSVMSAFADRLTGIQPVPVPGILAASGNWDHVDLNQGVIHVWKSASRSGDSKTPHPKRSDVAPRPRYPVLTGQPFGCGPACRPAMGPAVPAARSPWNGRAGRGAFSP